jgi:hypothetical protein
MCGTNCWIQQIKSSQVKKENIDNNPNVSLTMDPPAQETMQMWA